jgi:hypothetical protein
MPTGRDILFNPEHRTSDIKMVNGKNKETDVQYSRHKHWLFHSTLNVHLYKGSAKNNLVEFAPEFAVDLIDLIEQNRRNSELFRGLL